jgi:hypothetical protein
MRIARPILSIGLVGLAAVALVAAAGIYPTYRIVGVEGLWGLAAGAGASLVALLIGLVPTAWSLTRPAVERLKAMQISMAVRFVVVLVLALSLALSGWFHRGALLIWVGISYIAGLAGESVMLAMTLSRSERNPQ